MKHPKRRQRLAPSSKSIGFTSASAFRMEMLEDRQLLSATIELRTPSGGKNVTVTGVGQVINLDVWAVVRGADDDATNDAFQSAHGSFLSSDVSGGTAAGTLSATVLSPFDATASQNGTQADLDGDGDLDVGSNNDAQPTGYFIARAGGLQGGTNPAPAQFRIGTVSFTVTSLKSGGTTEINYRRRDFSLGVEWAEEFDSKVQGTDELLIGAPVVLSDPPPTATASAANLTSGGGGTYSFTVRYDDNIAVKSSTFDNNDIRVTGPNGFNKLATKVSVNASGDGKSRTVTYRIAAPGNVWDSTDNGTYTIALQGNQVSDTSNHFIAANANLRKFTVNVPKAVLAADGTLIVNGTNGNNTINLSLVSGSVRATVDGVSKSFTATSVKRISINGLAGNDTITIGAGVRGSAVDGGVGNDTVTGGTGNDTLVGGDGNDRLNGGDGNDWLKGGNGNDNVAGNNGNDRLDGGNNGDVLLGGAGEDPADYSGRNVGVVVLLDNINNDGQGGELDNVRTDVENVWGGSAGDRITGSSAANSFKGNGGNDTLFGGDGNDTLDGGGGADQLSGQGGNDRLLARDGVIDIVDGGAGSDSAQVDGNDKRTSIETLLA
ncbi:MAG TPA: calcium-binding protein [Tepidisphaeraceae bacterium]|nr:calcium-binding protein [Tepidisphaeraceae bacterium]